MNESVPKRNKNNADTTDNALIVDNVPTNSSNQAMGSGKLDLKPQIKKIARKSGQRRWKQMEVNETEKLEENSEVLAFLLKHWFSIRTFSGKGPVQDSLTFVAT